MNVLLAVECGGHPFWQRNRYTFVMIDTDTASAKNLNFSGAFSERDPNWLFSEVEYYIRPDGVYARFFSCGSGFGKVPAGDEFLLISPDTYDCVAILPNREKREAECNYNGNWQDNSDFEE